MSHEERDGKILEVFKEMFKSYDVNDDGTIKTSELGDILRSLGRLTENEFLDNHLIKRFDEEGKGTIAWNNNEFLLLVALMDVVDVNTISEAFVMAGFKIFDQDRHQSSIINN